MTPRQQINQRLMLSSVGAISAALLVLAAVASVSGSVLWVLLIPGAVGAIGVRKALQNAQCPSCGTRLPYEAFKGSLIGIPADLDACTACGLPLDAEQ